MNQQETFCFFVNLPSSDFVNSSFGRKTVALTIPETKLDERDNNGSFARARKWLNEQLETFAYKSKNSLLIDIASRIPRTKNNTRLWDDGLHLTPEGYDKMGELVYQGIQRHIALWISNYDRFFDT